MPRPSAARRRPPTASRSRPAERHDLEPALPRDLGEGTVGDDERGPRDREHPLPRGLAVGGVAQRAAVADDRHASDPAQPARRAPVGADRTEVGEVDDLAARAADERARTRDAASATKPGRGRDRDPRAARAATAATRAAAARVAATVRAASIAAAPGRRAERSASPRSTPSTASSAGDRRELTERATVAARPAARRCAGAPSVPGPTAPGPATLARSRSASSVGGGAGCDSPARELQLRRTVACAAHVIAPIRDQGLRQPAPSSRDRAVAALTASRIAARRPCASSSRSPAAVVPPGDVTAARNASGPAGPCASNVAEPSSVCTTKLARDVARQADEHARFDHRFRHEEDVRRTGSRQAGDRVEHRLGDAHHDADRAEQSFGEVEVLGGRRRTARRSPTRRYRRARACSASRARPADRERALRSCAIVTPAAIESTSVSAPQRGQRDLERRCNVARLHRDDHDVGVGHRPRRARHDAHLRELVLERAATFAVDLGDRQRRRLPNHLRADRRRAPRPSFRHRATQRVTSTRG